LVRTSRSHTPIAIPCVGIGRGATGPIVASWRRSTPMANTAHPVANRDSVDTRMVSQYIPAPVFCTDQKRWRYAVHRYGPRRHAGCVWETARGLNRNNAANRNAIAASGYTYLEVYLAGTGATTTARLLHSVIRLYPRSRSPRGRFVPLCERLKVEIPPRFVARSAYASPAPSKRETRKGVSQELTLSGEVPRPAQRLPMRPPSWLAYP
jgi:hypothetical protein